MTHRQPPPPRVLVSAASRHGSTTEIARVIGGTLADAGIEVDIVPPEAVDSLADYDAVVLGSAVYNGHWLVPARSLVARFQDALAARSLWLFSTGPAGEHVAAAARPTRPDPAEIAWISRAARPLDHRVFAGRRHRAAGARQPRPLGPKVPAGEGLRPVRPPARHDMPKTSTCPSRWE